MGEFISMLLLFGATGFGMVFMPAITKRTGISYSIIFTAIGALIYLIWSDHLPSPLPSSQGKTTLHMSELVVIISLMGAGIKIDRKFSIKNWAIPLRLVFLTMLLCMVATYFLGINLLELSLPAAVLVAAILAPTDPVLAEDVQVGPPEEKLRSDTKFGLTSEAGLNDGMAFPFTWLAILLALTNAGEKAPLLHWLGYYFFLKIAIGLVIGWLCGRLTGYLVFGLLEKRKLIKPTDGFLAISLTLLAYGLAEVLYGYGFVAVFIAGFTLRHTEKRHEYHKELHSFTDQVERLFISILLVFFGGALVSGILNALTIKMVVFSVLLILVVRPVLAYISLAGLKLLRAERLAISFLGIRGVGTIFYLAFAIDHAFFGDHEQLWALISFTILLSIILHGFSATAIMNYLSRVVPKQKIPD